MNWLPFSTELVQYLVDHRSERILALAQFASTLGEVEGYVVIVALVYTCFDKCLGIRLAVIALLAMTANHFLKLLIGNPRPFVADGTYPGKWAVSPENMRELASEYSTPSGHAMSAGAFYAFLAKSVRNRPVRTAALAAMLLTGLSRPYLGVHYLEDILLGWGIGIAFAVIAFRFQSEAADCWHRLGWYGQCIGMIAASLAVYLLTLWGKGGAVEKQPMLFVEYLGFLTGIVAAFPLEQRLVGFDPGKGPLHLKLVRWLFTVGLILLPLLTLDSLFGAALSEQSLLGQAFKYLGYAASGFLGIFVAPLIFVKVGMASKIGERGERRY